MQLRGIKIELASPKEMAATVKNAIAKADEVNTRVQRVSVDVGNWALALKIALKDLEKTQSLARGLRIQAERAKQKDSARQYGKIEDDASKAISQYSKLTKALSALDKSL